jgi:hypothetical protein
VKLEECTIGREVQVNDHIRTIEAVFPGTNYPVVARGEDRNVYWYTPDELSPVEPKPFVYPEAVTPDPREALIDELCTALSNAARTSHARGSSMGAFCTGSFETCGNCAEERRVIAKATDHKEARNGKA